MVKNEVTTLLVNRIEFSSLQNIAIISASCNVFFNDEIR